jgi:O-antigen ligase
MNGAQELDLDGHITEAAEANSSDSRVSLLLICVSASVLFFTAQITSVIPALGQFHIAKIITLAALILLLSSRKRIASRVRIRTAPPLIYFLGMLLLAIITSPFSIWPLQSLNYISDAYVKNFVSVYLMVQVMRTDREVRVLAGTLIIGCALQVIMMIAHIGPLITYQKEPYRMGIGGSYDPNDLALLFVITIPFAFFMLKGSHRLTQVLLLLAIALMLIGMVKTGSRGGFLGLISIGALIIMRGSAQARKYLLLTTAVGVILFVTAAPPAYWERINTIFNPEEDYNLTEKAGRWQVWETGLRMIAERPLTGVGISCFPIAHGQYTGSKLHISPHNSFLQVAAELGIAGLALFIAIILTSLKTARRIYRLAREGHCANLLWLASAVEVSFTGFIISGSFLTHAYSAIFCFLVSMAAVLSARYNASEQQAFVEAQEIEYA